MEGTRTRTLLAWGVHGLTASGAVVGLLALRATAEGALETAGLWMLVALVIDGIDGSLARRAQVSRFLPGIDGRRLDDIVDYLNYVVVPAFFMAEAGLLPHPGLAALPLLASAYGFSQEQAKTEDHFFLGFPSYWNVVALYLWLLEVPPAAGAALVALLAALVFVPTRYVYPSHMTRFGLVTNLGAALWIAWLAARLAWPARFEGLPAVEISLLYPAWYLGVSLWLGGWRRSGAG